MENLFDFEGGYVDYRLFTTPTDLKDELITHLTSYIQLYDQHRDRLQRTSESFTQAAVRVHEMDDDSSENTVVQGLLCVFGGVLGASCGAVAGGIIGALGAVSAATCSRFCGSVNALGATVGFVGGVFGGAVGGSFSGIVGGAAGAVAAATGCSINGIVSDVTWFTIGFATGGAIGGIFGGTVGAAGGAVGGAFGGLYATRFAVSVVGFVIHHFCDTKDSKEQKKETKKVDIIQKAGQDFHEVTEPLVMELKTIKMISDKMAPSDAVLGVSEQTAKTLTAVTVMERAEISESLKDLTNCVSSAEEVAMQCRQVTVELEKTRAEVEKLLVSLRKP
ncbi:uncharacterized protein LOC122971483 [Thunnus albacares]|uniref:uncharacterized protein LOC122971483 n=1 Tax=Thunnus albacares TaxID=8236 RepID=UPI001CF62787|nr:uncharacterized protein LOC122971483 [Thunnus albacares]